MVSETSPLVCFGVRSGPSLTTRTSGCRGRSSGSSAWQQYSGHNVLMQVARSGYEGSGKTSSQWMKLAIDGHRRPISTATTPHRPEAAPPPRSTKGTRDRVVLPVPVLVCVEEVGQTENAQDGEASGEHEEGGGEDEPPIPSGRRYP